MRKALGRTAAMLGAGLCAGCISLLPKQGEPIALYALDRAHAPAPATPAALGGGPVIRVDAPGGPIAILGDDLVWREDNAIAFVADAGWAGPARTELQRLLAEALGNAASVSAVNASGEGARPDLILRWDIAHFEVLQGPEGATAQFSASAQLLEARSRRLLGVRKVSAEAPVERRSAKAAAAALRAVAQQGVDEIARWAAAQAATFPTAPAPP